MSNCDGQRHKTRRELEAQGHLVGPDRYGIIDYLHLFDNNVYSSLFENNRQSCDENGDSCNTNYNDEEHEMRSNNNNNNNNNISDAKELGKTGVNGKLTETEHLEMVRELKRKEDGKLVYSRWIQVNQFPPLVVQRTDNWGFVLENEWVRFTSL